MATIELDNAVEVAQKLEARFGSLARTVTPEDAQRSVIGDALGYVKSLKITATMIQVDISETDFGREALKKLLDTSININGGTYYFYNLSFASEDHGDDMTFGGVERWAEVEFRLA